MKELSIEEKARRYDEALVRANEMIKAMTNIGGVAKVNDIQHIFPELKESKDESIRNGLIGYFRAGKCENISSYHGISTNDILAWLEKQGEQNPADKVEPKFHEGEWITNGDYTWKIVEVKPLDYILQSQDGNIVDDTISHVDEQFHSFTIKDAKDGDVLINWNNTTFIFKAIEDESVKFHIAYNEKWDTVKTPSTKLSHLGLPEPQFEFHPATKEQRDLLFQKMKEAGYEWDANKKELKKIDNWIEIPLGAKDSELQEAIYYIPKGFHAEIDDDKVVIKKGEKPAAWSEEDEEILYSIINDIEIRSGRITLAELKEFYTKQIDWLKSLKDRVILQPQKEWSDGDEEVINLACSILYSNFNENENFDKNQMCIGEIIDKLKSLKERYTWKPSDEQMGFLKKCIEAYNEVTFPTEVRVLGSLYNDLKKLREE